MDVPSVVSVGPEYSPDECVEGCMPGMEKLLVPKDVLIWQCQDCKRECIPIRSESRCLCGHRLREHKIGHTSSGLIVYPCSNHGCTCSDFFFIVAEGAWTLRCKCKHKSIEHDCSFCPYKCKRCKCEEFESPWVCNCDHPWTHHAQLKIMRAPRLPFMAPEIAPELNTVMRGME